MTGRGMDKMNNREALFSKIHSEILLINFYLYFPTDFVDYLWCPEKKMNKVYCIIIESQKINSINFQKEFCICQPSCMYVYDSAGKEFEFLQESLLKLLKME